MISAPCGPGLVCGWDAPSPFILKCPEMDQHSAYTGHLLQARGRVVSPTRDSGTPLPRWPDAIPHCRNVLHRAHSGSGARRKFCQLKFSRDGGQRAEKLRKKSRHVPESETEPKDLRP